MKRLFMLTLALLSCIVFGQNDKNLTHKLKLNEAISIAMNQNKKILSKKVDQQIAKSNEKIVFNEQLPEIEGHYSYNRMSRLRQYQNGGFKGGPTKYFLKRSMYELDGSAVLPIYKGGKLQREKKLQRPKLKLLKLELKNQRKI